MKQFFIADLHFRHHSIIEFDNRPFKSIKEMDDKLIENWNKKVGYNDEVYIVGDFIWKNKYYNDIINNLNGYKFLIKGNHDRINAQYYKDFEWVENYKEVYYKTYTIILSHYFIPFFNNNQNKNFYHLYGHSHCSLEFQKEQEVKKIFNIQRAYNIGACHLNYEPCTLEEIIGIWEKRLEKF